MNYLTFASTIVFVFSLVEGVYVLLLDPGSRINRLFFIMTFCITVWLFGAAMAYSAQTLEAVTFWFRFCSFGFIFLHPFTLLFTLALTTGIFNRRWHYLILLIFIPSVIFMYISVTGQIVFRAFIRAPNTWLGIPDYGALSFTLLIVNYVFCYLVSAFLLIRWRRTTTLKREKAQALIILVSIVSTILAFNLEPFLLPLFTRYQTIVISPIFSIIWITGVGIAVVKYRFLPIYPGRASGEILDNIDEIIVMFDSRFTPVYLNRRAREELQPVHPGEENGSVTEITHLYDIIENPATIETDLSRLRDRHIPDFSCRLQLQGEERKILDVKFSLIPDSYGDITGIILIGKEVKDELHLKKSFQLSEQEMTILRFLVDGYKIEEIAVQTAIAPRTVKYHCSKIYTKMHVKNKMELFRLLESYNLFPEQEAHSTSFPLLAKKE